jgi:hypothetical protein
MNWNNLNNIIISSSTANAIPITISITIIIDIQYGADDIKNKWI